MKKKDAYRATVEIVGEEVCPGTQRVKAALQFALQHVPAEHRAVLRDALQDAYFSNETTHNLRTALAGLLQVHTAKTPLAVCPTCKRAMDDHPDCQLGQLIGFA